MNAEQERLDATMTVKLWKLMDTCPYSPSLDPTKYTEWVFAAGLAAGACPFIVTSDEGTSYCRLAAREQGEAKAKVMPGGMVAYIMGKPLKQDDLLYLHPPQPTSAPAKMVSEESKNDDR